ncbi:hypothetical protein E6H29_10165 [Candidatus Bathyarchaeota archaeon]|nr:MAG: hypothetical protein E6H29_10165 [Candidatus Bathyarchaeota archaeon]
MTAILKSETTRPEDAFQDFFRSFQTDPVGSKYRKRLAQVAVSNGRSLIIDFEDLIAFDPALARNVVEHPDDFVQYAQSAATSQMRVEDPEYAEHAGRIFARFRRLPEKVALRKVGAENLKKMALVEGIVVRASQVRPTIVRATFRCRKCMEIMHEEQSGELMRGPGSTCPFCKQKSAFELLEEQSQFKNTQEARVQERPEDLPPGQLPRYLDVRLDEDLVDTARPGDRVGLTSIIRAEKQFIGEKGRARTFNLYLEANYVEVVGKETEIVEITSEDEKAILEASKDPWIHRKLIQSIAPSIYGYEDVKEAILYLLCSGVAKQLPDGVNIRGDSHTLIIGDPGCLVGDERVILGDGSVVKIQDLGDEHLQDIDAQVLTGAETGARDAATRFHHYLSQPTIEIVTESGKSIRGTFNHPLLAVDSFNRTPVYGWKRLDEFKVGDRVAVATEIPCTIRRHVKTGWRQIPYRRGPRFHGKLPKTLTPQLAAFLGYILGDGWVQRYRVGFTVAEGEKDILEPLCEIAEKLFGIEPAILSGHRKGRKVILYEACIHSQNIAHNLAFLREKRIPDLVLKSGNKAVSSFLRWLFEADGTVFSATRGCGVIGLKAKNIELLRDVQVLLLRFAIHSRIIENALLIKRGESILKFATKIGFASLKKRGKLVQLAERARRLKRLKPQRSERVFSIKLREPSDVFDIEVPRTHQFIANGIVSHNTAKSQLLQYVSRIAPRGLYTSGRGSSAAGLTAAVLREKTGGMVLEAGALVLADKGIACLHPDSQVIVEGTSTRIGDLFDVKMAKTGRTKAGHLLDVSLLERGTITLDLDSMRAREATATLVTRRDYDGPLQCLRMKSGFELRVTPDHLLLDGPRFSWRAAEEIRVGDRLLTVQRLPGHDDEVRIIDILPGDWIVEPSPEERAELRKRALQHFRSIAAANRHYGLRRETLSPRSRDAIRLNAFRRLLSDFGLNEWRDRTFAYGRSKETERLRVAQITPDLAYILGFIYGDGYVRSNSKQSIVRITQSELHRRQIDRLQQASSATLNAPWHDGRKLGSGQHSFPVHDLRHDSNLLFALYDWTTRDALQNLLRLGQEALAGFLAGCMDSDGCISTKRYRKGGREYCTVEITFSLSDDLAENRMLLLVLRRFDVYARIRQQKGVKIVQTTGRQDVARLVRVLTPYSIKQREIPTRSTAVSSDNEEVPERLLAGLLKNIRPVPSELLRVGDWSTFWAFQRGTRRPFKSGVRRLRDALDKWLSPEQAVSLEAFCASDYAMDEVVSVKTEFYKGPVYDLRVPEGSSFLADGICVHNCIDEIDKMLPIDRVAIHEALEQQTVSIAKGGIVATLNARASVLAAGNPKHGRYDPYMNVYENINLDVTILSRFDLIFLLKDEPDEEYDSRMATHILELHKTKLNPEAAPFPPDFLRKYISYSKRFNPVLSLEALKELQDFYLKMRIKGGKSAAVAITPRQLEALVRLAEARARAFLRDQVIVEDAKSAIRIMNVSLEDVGIDVKTGTTDIDVIMTGIPRSYRDSMQKVVELVRELSKESGTAEETLVLSKLEESQISEPEARRLIGQLIKDGILYVPKAGRLKRV